MNPELKALLLAADCDAEQCLAIQRDDQRHAAMLSGLAEGSSETLMALQEHMEVMHQQALRDGAFKSAVCWRLAVYGWCKAVEQLTEIAKCEP